MSRNSVTRRESPGGSLNSKDGVGAMCKVDEPRQAQLPTVTVLKSIESEDGLDGIRFYGGFVGRGVLEAH